MAGDRDGLERGACADHLAEEVLVDGAAGLGDQDGHAGLAGDRDAGPSRVDEGHLALGGRVGRRLDVDLIGLPERGRNCEVPRDLLTGVWQRRPAAEAQALAQGTGRLRRGSREVRDLLEDRVEVYPARDRLAAGRDGQEGPGGDDHRGGGGERPSWSVALTHHRPPPERRKRRSTSAAGGEVDDFGQVWGGRPFQGAAETGQLLLQLRHGPPPRTSPAAAPAPSRGAI